ncbi:PPK2 family polyphosphate kinase [Nitrosomonas communis]|uniref:Polyphosphate:nucleotide phosphotransferase, PPK2 family n=1 Tax=Nitrosomonas communis TaxID=44574 RepID=A0A1H2VMQ8_9PROT|nr:PPK2 family polyphosphate kinase [Nitrosomonas communis]SDW69576.1 polyphosphate:nucleotide phosphotransferase, PPK2 family [Nitrosomonas communis]
MALNSKLTKLKVDPNTQVDLADWTTSIKPLYSSKKKHQELLSELHEELGALQDILYAHNRYALLLILQGIDSAGKGSIIKHVMTGINPQGCQVYSFQQPTAEDLDHDFLWRSNNRLPERGRIGIFDRSYYEEVTAVRVIPGLLERQHLPMELLDPTKFWQERFQDIVNLESHLHRNGTRTVKIFLHLSKEEQRQRLLERIDEPKKNWKISRADIEARQHWEAFQTAYAECLSATSTEHSPWYIVPADDKLNAQLLVSKIVTETMKTLQMNYPIATEAHRKELAEIREALEKE